MALARDQDGALTLGGVRLVDLAEDPAIGTPSYVYDLDAMAAEARALHGAFDGAPHLVAYAVKANSAGPVVRTLAAEGCGADVVSGAELLVALGCGVAPEAIVFSGVAKSDAELELAIGAGPHGIGAIQLESIEEAARVDARARALGRRARVSIRVNPAVDLAELDTHAHIATGHDEAKFGTARDDLGAAFDVVRAAASLELVGLTVHVGSQFTSVDPYVASARVLFEDAVEAMRRGFPLQFLDAGGGFGIDYGAGCAARPADFIRAARAEQRAARLDALELRVEPGRCLVAAFGVLVARVIQQKIGGRSVGPLGARRWAMIDAGMNDLLRPALYQACHRVVPADRGEKPRDFALFRVVGPVCESSDDFGEHELPLPLPALVALLDAGAYGYTMASRYNGRPLPAEVFLGGGRVVALETRRPIEAWAAERIGTGT